MKRQNQCDANNLICKVAPPAGAWIETTVLTLMRTKNRSSRPPRARGLKLVGSPHMLDRRFTSRPPRARGLKSDHRRQPPPLFTSYHSLSTIHHQPSTIYYQLSTIPHRPCADLDCSVKSAPVLRTGDAAIELFCYNANLNWHIKEEKTEWVKLKLS